MLVYLQPVADVARAVFVFVVNFCLQVVIAVVIVGVRNPVI